MDFSLLNSGLSILVGFFIGITIGMTGIGGGALVMPALIYILKIPPVPAVGTSLAYAILTRIGGLIEHLRLKTIRKRTGLYFILGSAPAVLLSSQLLNQLSRKIDPAALNPILQVSIGIVLLITCGALIFETYFLEKLTGKSSNEHYIPRDKFPLKRKIGGICSGIIVGSIVGATSIGGGVLLIPLLIIFFNLSASNTVGTSMMISVVLAVLGGSVYLLNGNVIILTVILMTIGSLPGVSLGSRIAVRLPEKVLKFFIIAIIGFAAVSLFFGLKR
ncbi:MAG: sulfite exporter TauE/SafE family protein [Nitrospirae bacterium]|nr:sulfite exporter TauE/SafE family protein [Nitrospirota bacterium]